MSVTHIVIEFENVQPSSADIRSVRGDGLRLAIFRGPSQLKYSADVAEAWQPLGSSVTFIPCAKAGRNAVDLHIASIRVSASILSARWLPPARVSGW